MTRAGLGGLQGLATGFCTRSKLAKIAALLASPNADSQASPTSSGLEASVLEFGQHWDFRENLWKQHAALEQWLLEEEPAQLAANLLQSDQIWLLRDQTYFKPPGSEHTPWHQDALFIPVEGCTFLTLWIPLTPIADIDDAPLEYWQPPHACCHLLEGGSALSHYKHYEKAWRQDETWKHLTTLGLQPGDCSFHDGWTLHGSQGHQAAEQRLAFVAVYGCGEGVLRLKPSMAHAPTSLRNQAQLLRQGLHQSCFAGMKEGDPVPGYHNPWIRSRPSANFPIHSPHTFQNA